MVEEKDYRLEQIWDNEIEGLEWKMQETKSLIEIIKKEAQKEVYAEIKQDFADGEDAEHICMKYIDRLKQKKSYGRFFDLVNSL